MKHPTRPNFVASLSILISIAVLTFDLSFPLGVAGGVPYVALVLVGLFSQRPHTVIILAIVGSALTLLGYALSPPGGELHVVLINRALALFAIWSTAIVCYMHLNMLARLEPLATTDQLTGMYNRHYFSSEVLKQINFWRRHQQPLSLAIMDIDHFKKINDTYGHLAGDHALKKVAEVCCLLVRDSDTVARIGGEEFAILLPATEINGALLMAERIRKEVEKKKFKFEQATFSFTVSLGIAEIKDESWSITELLGAADQALYLAKTGGRNRTVLSNMESPQIRYPNAV